MLHDPAHPVTLAPNSNPGYDFTLALPGERVLRVSCLAVQRSGRESAFQEFARALASAYAAALAPGRRLAIVAELVEPDHPAALRPAMLGRVVRTSDLASDPAPDGRGRAFHSVGPWRVLHTGLAPEGHLPFDERRASFDLSVVAPMAPSEQLRFTKRAGRKVRNLAEHCPVGPSAGNALMIRLPGAVSMPTARAFLERIWDDASAHVAAAVLVRAQVVTSPDLAGSTLTYEVEVVGNPRASVGLGDLLPPGFDLRMHVPIGQIATEEPRWTLRFVGGELPLAGHYVFVWGEHHYVIDADVLGTFDVPSRPNTATTLCLRYPSGPPIWRRRFLKTDEMVLL